MTTVLIGVSIVSSVAALAMAVVVIRMVREERHRSNARIEALMRLGATQDDSTPWREYSNDPAYDSGPGEREAAFTDLDVGPPASAMASPEPASSGTLFAEPQASRPWRARLAAAGAAAAALLLVVFAVSSVGSSDRAPATRAVADRPIELLALRHTAQPATLTVTGVVQNPRDARERSQVTAIALAFADDGTFLGSGQAPLDFTHLRAGDESPFTVRVATPRAAARYRVSFRDADGRVVTHVDRRTGAAMARKD